MVEYVEVIPGKLNASTIDFDIDLKDLQLDKQRSSSRVHDIRIFTKLMASNKGLKKQLNMLRLLFATGIELIKYFGTIKE